MMKCRELLNCQKPQIDRVGYIPHPSLVSEQCWRMSSNVVILMELSENFRAKEGAAYWRGLGLSVYYVYPGLCDHGYNMMA